MSSLKQNLVVVAALAITCVAQSLASAQFERDPDVLAAFEAGKTAMQAGEWEAAILEFDKAIAKDDGTFAELFFGKAEALRELEDYQNAIAVYKEAISANEQFAQAFNGRGICYRETEQLQLALNDFDTAANLDRRDPTIAANYGDLLVNQFQNPVNAMIYLDRAIELNPEDAEAYANRGWAHALLREFEDAVTDLTRSIELLDSDYKTYQKLANVHFFEEDYEPGIAALSKAIEFYKPEESSDPDVYIDGYMQRANARIEYAKEQDQSPEQREQLYQAVVGDADAVLAEFDDRFPESGRALYYKGVGLRMQGLFAEAITAFTDAIQLIPPGNDSGYSGEAYRTRGICWFYQGQNNLARGDFKEAASKSLEDPLPYLWMGFTFAEEKDYRKAIDNYGEAIAKKPDFPLAHVNKGLAYAQLKDYEKAVDNFNEAIRAEPTEPKHFVKRGLAHEQLEEWQKALDSYNLALLRDNNLVAAHRGAARALRELGRDNLANIHENKAREIEAGIGGSPAP